MIGPRHDDLATDYASHGFRRNFGFGTRPAVLVVDVVRAYLDPGSPLYAGVEQAVASAALVVQAARAAGVPVLFTTVRYAPGGSDSGVWWRKIPALRVLEEGSELGDFPESLRPSGHELVFVKQFASAFFGTSLAATLTRLGIDTLLVTGLTTSGCVRASVIDAMQHGFVPVVVRDAVGDRDPRPHEANLFDMESKYADVVSEAEAVQYLRGVAY
jgi:maleamate amidohydrolase